MYDWKFEILDSNTWKVVHSEAGFETESEAEFFANVYVKQHDLHNHTIRTLERRN